MTGFVTSFLRDRRSAIQVEYVLIAALVGAATGVGLSALGDAMDGAYQPIVHSAATQSHALPAIVDR